MAVGRVSAERFEWERAAPASQGMDVSNLHQARQYALTGEGSGYIIRHGKLVMSWGDPKKRYDLKSTTKSIGVTALGLAILDGKMKLTDRAKEYHPTLANPPENNVATGWPERITILHLVTQTAGFEKPGGYGKLLFEPGTRWHYSDAGPNWLAECITLVYGRDMDELMFERVFSPLGIERTDLTWRRNAYRAAEINGVMRREFGSGISANVDAMARIGYLYLLEGEWNGKPILPQRFIARARTTVPEVVGLPEEDPQTYGNASDHYGLLWWNNADRTLTNVPRDAYWSWGLYDSLIVVIPSLDIVVSRAGKSWARRGGEHYAVLKPFLEPICASVADSGTKEKSPSFVRVSKRDPRYLELSSGEPYIPIGLNLLQAYSIRNPEEHMAEMERWVKTLSENGGNYIRVWLSAGFWDVEHQKSGVYDEEKAKRIDALLALARKYNIRVKMTIEHFRSFDSDRQRWAAKPLHHVSQGGPAKSIADFFNGERSREQFKKKLAWYANRYGNEPMVYGWELWNEINAVRGGDYMAWTEVMLAELHRLFPGNLAMQSLGSFDNARKRQGYRHMSTMEGNDVAQVHRYLDLGASLAVCKGPVDVLSADAVQELLAFNPGRPVILAESGAVEPSHSGPSKLYDKDQAGIILHDVLFAPFFAGAAGSGQIWHWDRYVDKNDLWWQFGRFAEAVKNLDPPAEGFEPFKLDHPRLRIYVLKGRRTILAWCRDYKNTWNTELAEGTLPETIRGLSLDLRGVLESTKAVRAKSYDPWEDRWQSVETKDSAILLPAFRRSLVVRIDRRPRSRGPR